MVSLQERFMNKITKRIPEIEPTYDYVFGYLEDLKPFSPELMKSIISYYETIINQDSIIKYLSPFLSFKPKKTIKYVFIGRKNKDLLLSIPREEVLVIGSWKDWLYCLWHRIPFRMGLQVTKAALDCYTDQKLSLTPEVQKILKFKKDAANKFFVVFSNDSLPVERIYCLLAKSLGMHSVCIQDGVFQSNSPARAYHGGVADLMLAFDKHQFDLLVNGGVPKNKLGVVGFHSNIEHYENISYDSARRVCILGQPWGVYSAEIEVRYHALLENLNTILTKSEFTFAFKPHPSEHGTHYLEKNGVRVESEKLKACLARYDVFISFTSTALIEASIAGRVAIQIYDPTFLADRFSEFGYAYSVDSNDLNQLSKLVREALPIDINYSGTISDRFQAAIRSHIF
jgi:hypothetical protein